MTSLPIGLESARTALAAHEAGHCLFTWIFPLASVERVEYSLVTGAGQVKSDWPMLQLVPETIFPIAAMTLAGIAAEIALIGRFRSKESAEDLRSARQLSETLSCRFPQWPRLVRQIQARYPGPDRLNIAAVYRKPPGQAVRQLLLAEYRWARGLLAENELKLRRLAARLYQQPSLTVEELSELLGPQR